MTVGGQSFTLGGRSLEPIPSLAPIELVFDLLPTAYEFSRGQRIRITIAFADKGNFDTPVLRMP